MSAVVFCLACQKVMDITEYLHPSHECAVRSSTPNPRRRPDPRILHPQQPRLIDEDDIA